MKNNILETALFYSGKLRWSTIPIGKDKKPLIEWKKYQTEKASNDLIKQWWVDFPEANIGVVTGKISNLVVIDIDPRHGGNNADFNRIVTIAAKTGGGGWHYYFQYEEGFQNQVGIKPGIDIRAEGGYVIVPPSIHQSSELYKWTMSPQAGTSIIPLPTFVKEWVKNTKQSGMSNWDISILKGVEQGRRNSSAASIAGKFMAYLPSEEWEECIWPYMEQWNSSLKEPLSIKELRMTYDSIASRELTRRQNVETVSIPAKKTLGLSLPETNINPKIMTWQEFIKQEDISEPWIIDDILRPGWLAVLGGHGKHGKSTLSIHLLNALLVGDSFINPCQNSPVIYFNCEMAETDIKELIKTIYTKNQGEKALVINNIPLPLNPNLLEKILQEQDKPGVCVIDSFRGAFMLSGDTENQAGTVGGILRRLQLIARQTKWSIILIHHFRKSGTGDTLDLAGSGEWISAPDVILTWSCPNPKEDGQLTIRGRVPPIDPLAVTLSRERIEFHGTVIENKKENDRQIVMDSLESQGKTSDQIVKETDLAERNVRRILEELLKNNVVVREGEGKRGEPFTWSKRLEENSVVELKPVIKQEQPKIEAQDDIPNSEKVKNMTIEEHNLFVNSEWEKIEKEFS